MLGLIRRLFRPSQPVLEGLRPTTPEQLASNAFVRRFAESEQIEIEVSPEHIASGSPEYEDFAGIEFARIRNRFRILSNLDPVVSREEQAGIIRFSYRSGESMSDVVMESRFPAVSETFYLKKMSLTRRWSQFR